jgi:hypothetical protein
MELCFLVINDKNNPVHIRIPATFGNHVRSYCMSIPSAQRAMWYEYDVKQNDGNIYTVRIWGEAEGSSFWVREFTDGAGTKRPHFEFTTFGYTLSLSCKTSKQSFQVLFWVEIPRSSDLQLAQCAKDVQLVRPYPALADRVSHEALLWYITGLIDTLKSKSLSQSQ